MGSMSSKEITNDPLSYKGLKSNIWFQIFRFIVARSFESFAFYEFIKLYMTYRF